MKTRLTERDITRIVKRVINEQDETTAVTPTLPKEKVHPIKPTEYENVKRMIQSSLQKGKSVTITISTGESKIVGLADVTGILRTADLMKILP